METAKRAFGQMIAKCAMLAFALALLGCGEWTDATVGRTSCSFRDWLPAGSRPLKMAAGNNGNALYILDNSSKAHYYKRDNIYDCAFYFEDYYSFNGFPNDVLFAGSEFYIQDKAQLKFMDGKNACDAKDGIFAVNGNELAVGSNSGIEIWSIKPCARNRNVSSRSVFALAAANGSYYAAEGAGMLQNLTMYGLPQRSEPLSVTPGNEKNFCSADRLAANSYGVYLLDKKCKKIGVFSNSAEWLKTINIDSLGIRNPLDIAADEYSYIFILHETGVEKINVF